MSSRDVYVSSEPALIRRRSLFGGALCLVALLPGAIASGETSSVTARLTAMPEAAYVGGMPVAVVEVAADVRQDLQTALGGELPVCEPPDALQGSIVANDVGMSPPKATPASDPTLRELQELLASERRFVQDAAAFIIGEIGPAAASLDRDLRGDRLERSAWFSHALGRVTCERYAIAGVLDRLPEGAKAVLAEPGDSSSSLGVRVGRVARLIQHPDRVWPDDFFSSAIASSELQWELAEAEHVDTRAVQAIADRVVDRSSPMALRLDLLRVLDMLDDAARPAAPTLWPLAQESDDQLSFQAAWVVASTGGELAIDANALLVNRFESELVGSDALCGSERAARLLGPPLRARLAGEYWNVAAVSAGELGCIDPIGSAAALRAALDHPSWEVQVAAIGSLARSAATDPVTRAALASVQENHWSGLVRQHAEAALSPPPVDDDDPGALDAFVFKCFHRCLTDHLRRCGDEDGVVDGLYVSPSMGELQVEWERVRRVPRPPGFPLGVEEDSRADYGTSTYLRVDGGWLFATDRWHYDGVLAFASDAGEMLPVGLGGDIAAAIVQTPHFGPALLGGSYVSVREAGLLASIDRSDEGWRVVPRVALPSPPWGWAFAPNGTLLVADPYEAVAVLADGRIESLACPVRAPAHSVNGLRPLVKRAPRLSDLKRRDLVDALATHQSVFAAQRERNRQVARNPAERESWETPKLLDSWLSGDLDQLLHAYLAAGRAAAGLQLIAELPPGLADVGPGTAFQLYAAAGRPEQARARLEAPTAANDADALKIGLALALAERRVDDADAVLRRLDELEDRQGYRSATPDHFLEMLRWVAAEDDPARDELLTATDGWPGPVQAHLTGRISERELALASHRRDGQVDREKLCEALFYRGLKLAAAGRTRAARSYFQAVVDLGVEHFLEYAVAAVLLDR